jgi:small-conductance mechanosensitive channel
MLWLLVLCAATASAFAAEEAPKDALKSMVDKVNHIERNLSRDAFGITELEQAGQVLEELRPRAASCISDSEAALIKTSAALEKLGEKKAGESVEVVKQRRQLEDEQQAIEARLAECSALAINIASLQEQISEMLKALREQRMLARGPDIIAITQHLIEQPLGWFPDSWNFVAERSWLIHTATARDLLWAGVVMLVGLGLGLLLRWRGLPAVARRKWSDSTGGRFASSVLASCCHDIPYVLAAATATIYLAVITRNITPLPFVSVLAYGLFFLFIANLLIRISLAPTPPGKLFLDVPAHVARPMARRFRVLAVLMLVAFLLLETILATSLPVHVELLLRNLLRILFAINIVWVLWLFRHLSGVKRQAWFRHLLSLVLIVAVFAGLGGYSNLASWLFRSVFGSLLAFGVVMTVSRLLRELLIGLEYGSTRWERRARRFLGLPATEEHLGGFFWVRMLVALGMWTLLVWVFILIWDLSASAVQDINRTLTEGFVIGSLKIVPGRIMLAVVTLAALIALAGWMKGRVDKQLQKSPMERGSREAAVTVAGYSGVLLAILVALGVAGIDFSNLALIAGALSVGIGFGLQNVVNNFVSGLILLIERPIKTGDWIVVGGTEGYVKRIRIRSTQIQTFDRADVIVPNSELISGQVTNWMLHDVSGRARIPVGVAYGSETQQVNAILLKIAHEHPGVITYNPELAPVVLFRGFGDSALDFELRVHIRNIDNRLRVISDLNFAIDAAFREAGITIPFPQRDVHLIAPPAPGPAGT